MTHDERAQADFLTARRKAFWNEIQAFLNTPLVRIIRERNVLTGFPRRTEADLCLWIMDHRHYLCEWVGAAVGAEQAAVHFTDRTYAVRS